MKLERNQIDFYAEKGYLLLENLFSADEINQLLREMPGIIGEDSPRRILEKNGSVRTFFAPHLDNLLMNRFATDERLLTPSRQLLQDDIYLYQSKLNTKFAMTGDWWDWHQDYTYWKKDDGVKQPQMLTAMIYLNDVNEFNGPLLVIPGSHDSGSFDEEENKVNVEDEKYEQYVLSEKYLTSLTADLKYTLKQKTIFDWATEKGLASLKGKAGSVLFFHCNLFHASSNNMSPWDRHTYLLTYNAISNFPADVLERRPDFLVNWNPTIL
ncbi:MAG: phytanoyl-CoA dioxygenase family protein [Chitinophagaceae bacterium]